MLEIKPIFSALLRHKSSTLLIVLQIAITLAVLVNAVSIINQRMTMKDRPTGLAEANQFMFNVNAFGENYNVEQNIRADMDMIRNLPGVISATPLNQVPLTGSGDSFGLASSQENFDNKINFSAGIYRGDHHVLDTLGVKLVAGRNFTSEEVIYGDGSANAEIAIITQSLANKLFPDEDALGKLVYWGGGQTRIIGIVDIMAGSWVHWSNYNDNFIAPIVRLNKFKRYLIKAEADARNDLVANIERMMIDRNPERVITSLRTMDEIKTRAYSDDMAMSKILWVVITLLVLITSLGIIGIVSFNVNQRIKQIGTRRALGATQGDIQRYFITENLLISGLGLTLGTGLAMAFNIYLVDAFELSPIEWFYIPAGMFIMLFAGLLAVWIPAKKASAISPAVATQSI